MLRAVHVAERKIHHFVEDFHGIFRGFRKADTENAVDAFGVALVTDVMTVHAASLAEFFFMADRALHQNIFIQIFQRRTDHAFQYKHA